jgi:hypothetical protein
MKLAAVNGGQLAFFLCPESHPMADESTPNESKRDARRGADADNEARLARYGFADLPDVFAIQNPDRSLIQERQACYQCMSDGFYGRGVTGTYYQEGDIIVAEFVPNEQMMPLNRAAALKVIAWRESLPQGKAPVDIGDMAEAAQMLAKDPRVTDLPPDDYQRAVIELATRLKIKRLGKDALELPQMSAHNFAPVSGGKSPPILGAKLSDMAQRGPGFNHPSAPGSTAIGGVRRATSAPAPLGGNPQR